MRVLGNADTRAASSPTRGSASAAGARSGSTRWRQVYDGFSEQTSIAKINDRQVVTFGIERAKGASDVTVYDAAIEELKKIEEENPGIQFTQLFTSVDYTKEQYETSMAAMVEGSILAVIVVFLFLRDWRATIISALAIPLSAIPTFWFMDLLGFTLNELSLLALEPRRRRAGRRCDRRDREHRQTHAHGQERLPGVDRRRRRDRPGGGRDQPCRSSRCSCRSA